MNYRDLIFGSMLVAGLFHFVTAPERFHHADITTGLLYLALGIFQMSIALLFLTNTTPRPMAKLIAASCLFLLVVFGLNQLFAGQVPMLVKEPYSLSTLLRKLSEIIALASSCLYLRKTIHVT